MAKKNGGAEKVKPSEVAEQISEKKLKALLKTAGNALKESQEINGEIGQHIKSAIDNDHLHRKAFAVLRQMDRMTSPEKLADFWDTLQYYVDASGLGERAKAALRLNFDDGEGEDEDHEAAEAKGSNVRGFPAATH